MGIITQCVDSLKPVKSLVSLHHCTTYYAAYLDIIGKPTFKEAWDNFDRWGKT